MFNMFNARGYEGYEVIFNNTDEVPADQDEAAMAAARRLGEYLNEDWPRTRICAICGTSSAAAPQRSYPRSLGRPCASALRLRPPYSRRLAHRPPAVLAASCACAVSRPPRSR